MSVLKDINEPKLKGVSDVTKEKKDEGKKEQSAADRIMEANIKGKEVRAMEAGLYGAEGKPSEKGEDSESMKMAKQAIDMQASTMTSIDEARKLTQIALDKAEATKNEAMAALFTYQMATIEAAEKRVTEATDKAKEGGAKENELDTFVRIKDIVDKIAADSKPKEQAPVQQGRSDETEVILKKMELEQARLLIQMDGERLDAKRDWDLKYLEFQEESKRRWAEYQDGRTFKQEGLSGFQDLAHAIGEGITKERKGVGSETVTETEEESAIQVSTSQFPCQYCEEKVKIEPDSDEAVCDGCGARYEIRKRG